MFDIANLPQPLIRHAVGLWRRRWIVLCVAWLAAIAFWGLIWLIPDTYESRGQIFVQTENVLEPAMRDITAPPNYQERVEVMQRALLTRQNIEKIILRAGVDSLIEAGSPEAYRVEMEKMVDFVQSRITIDSPQTMFFDIRFKFGEPTLTRNVVDAILDLFIEQDLGASLQEKEDARRKLDRQIARFEERLATKDQEVARFRGENAEQLALVENNARRRELLEIDLSNVSNELAVARRSETTLATQLATTPRTSTNNELGKLKVELARLRSQFTDDYPEIRKLLVEIEELESAGTGALPDNPAYKALAVQVRSARDQVAALSERERKVRTDLEALNFKVAQVPQVQADLQRIMRDYEQTQKSYEELVQRRDRFELTTQLGPGAQGVKYEVLEHPRVALQPSFPPRLLLILASVVAAFGAGGAAAMLLTALDKSFTQTQALQSTFGLPVLGAVSEVSSSSVKARRRGDLSRLGGAIAALVVLCGAYVYWEVFRVPSTAKEATNEGVYEEREGAARWA
ncbi:MAG: XrtA system polysaccharide chain length determinant [Pseudomonadota bacterium]